MNGQKETVTETRYYESDKAFLARILGQRKGWSASILVIWQRQFSAGRRKSAAPPVFIVTLLVKTPAL